MTTTTVLMPLDPVLSAQHVSRVLTISADLLPDEIVAARQARRTRSGVVAVVVLVIVALGGWYVRADRQLAGADAQLETVTAEVTTLQHKQGSYSELVGIQADISTLAKQLRTLLGNDLPWASLIDTLRDTGTDAGVTVRGMTATLTAAAAGQTESAALPSTSGSATVGTVTITGTAPNKPAVAKYVDSLGDLTNVADPYLTSVVEAETEDVQFSLTVDIPAQALCGRYTTRCKTTGGK